MQVDEPEAGQAGLLPDGGFPDVARLELDELLEQLIDRARDVQATQWRLRGLLRANQAVASVVDLEDVLGQILEAARTLVDAGYAALGVIDQGRLTRFLHVGMEEETVTAIGHLPEGKGLLGRLIDYPQPLRLPSIGAHVASVGFPDAHPPMQSFLGVPIRVGDHVFGNLYLTDKRGGEEFTQDDEEMVTALASAAGAALTNAAAFAAAGRRQRWQAAMSALSTGVLTSMDTPAALDHMLRHAVEAADCVGACVAVAAEDPASVRVSAATGVLTDLVDVVAEIDGSLYAEVMTERRCAVVPDLATHPASNIAGAGPTVVVPVLTELAVDGALFLCRAPGATQFDSTDLELLTAYASHAALVLQLSRSRRDNEQLRRAEDRLHIAEDLQGDVLQRLSRLGLDLQSLAARTTQPLLRDTLQAKVEETDVIIRALRQAIFAVRPGEQSGS